MIQRLFWAGISKQPLEWLFTSLLFLVGLFGAFHTSAQSLNTQPLTVTSVCQGSQIEVTGIRSSLSGILTVELSNGGNTYAEIPSSLLSASGRYEITYLATIPANTPAGSHYRIRLVSKNPDIIGTPSSTSLTVRAKPAAPTVSPNSVLLCQSQSASPLSATTTDASASLVWYGTNATGGIGSMVASLPSTAAAGTFSYYVTQKVNDCESERAAIKVEIKPTPTAPTVQPVTVCLNAPAPVLQVAGQNLLWYTSNTGGTGLALAPVVSTSQTGQITYYVSQSPTGCESTRSVLSVTINSIPGVPAVASAGPVYCRNATAIPLVASGQGLNWYHESSAGTSLGNNVIPDTKDEGNFIYYVSQTVNGCEGSRSSIMVKVTAAPPAPSVTNAYSYCQGTQVSTLTATGNGLKWYDASGKNIDSAPTPSTNASGTVSYFVTQTTDKCESSRSEIKVTIKPAPGPPNTTAVSVCQNESAKVLSADGQNLLWYTTENGGTGLSTAPTLTTGQTGQVNYYVSQRIDGCEGLRATLSTTVKSLPAAPIVTQKNLCQFAPTELVSAVGNGLIWYTAEGSKLASAPLINTDKAASFTILVAQTVNGCEGAKATLTVNVLSTPIPTVGKTIVEICQGVASQPLSASGNNLKWTDPNGTVTTTAPTPPVLNVTVKPEGDVYSVTQTGANGCESPKAAIRVFVQTVPTMSILGTTTTNLGLEVPLKLTFTGVGPYSFKLSNGLSGISIKDTTLLVLPERTTIYKVAEVANKCGTGLSGSSPAATVTVMIPTIQTLAFTSTTLCAGAVLTTSFMTSGAFNPGSVFKLQVAKIETDSTKTIFVDALSSQDANGEIIGILPRTSIGGSYLVRVIATNPKIPINGSASPTKLTIRPLPTAKITSSQTSYEGQPTSLSVSFTGESPWGFSYRDSTASGLGPNLTVSTNANPYTVEVKPSKTTSYLLTGINNVCGNGTILRRLAVVTLIPLLGIEDQPLADAVDVYPVPATTTLTVRIRGLSTTEPAVLELTDLTGRTTSRQETRQTLSTLSLDQQPAGIYILHINVGARTVSKRIVKF